MQEREIADLKIDRLIARIYHYSMVGLAVASTSAIVGSIPLVVLNALPIWADIALSGSGALIAPGSIVETSTTRKGMKEAEQLVTDWEQNHQL